MRIFIFKSQGKGELRAFAGDPGGQQLPTKFGPWYAVGVVRPEKELPYNLGRDVIEAAINSQGFQLFRMKSKKVAAG
jgi:hypothetical protein